MSPSLAEQIATDLRARLSAGFPAEGLTLAGLAAEYRVSVTPVRRAVGRLVREGLLEKTDRGRLALPSDAAMDRTAPAPRPPERPDLEGTLSREIVEASLRGRPTFVREEPTARRFGVSRTVVRQVLSRLAGRGFVSYLPRRGWRVRALDREDMAAYLTVREVLELRALDLAFDRLEREDLERMLAGNAPGRDPIDNEIHGYLVEKAGNPYIADFFERNAPFYHAIFDAAAPGAKVTARMAGQHRAILRALLEGDRAEARRRLAEHVRAQLPVVGMLLEELARRDA